MSTLVLELKPGETMLINGATLRFRTKARLELTSRARFLFGKQIMSEHEAVTPARRLYLLLQRVYIGSEDERAAALSALSRSLPEIAAALPDIEAGRLLALVLTRVEAGECYAALKLARQLVRLEVAGAAEGTPGERAATGAPGPADMAPASVRSAGGENPGNRPACIPSRARLAPAGQAAMLIGSDA